MMKVAIVREPETFFEASKDPGWIETMNEEMHALRGTSFPPHHAKRRSDADGYTN